MMAIISGSVTGIAIIFVYLLFAKIFSAKLFAGTNLIAIAFIYVGFSLSDESTTVIVLECTVALAFYFAGTFGNVKYKTLTAIGIMLHGIWDIAHFSLIHTPAGMPTYWPTYCLTIDIIDGLFFYFILRREAKLQVSKLNYSLNAR